MEVNTTNDGVANSVTRLRLDPNTGDVVVLNRILQTESIIIPERTVRIFAAGDLRLRDGSGTTQTDSFVITGGFTLSLSDTDLSVNAFGFINLSRLTAGFTLQVDGSFTINSLGIVAALSLGGSARQDPNGDGYLFDARLRLEIKTTTLDRQVLRPSGTATTARSAP